MMNNWVVASLLSSIGLGGLLATAAAASVDTSPKPGGVYRLKPGIFVEQGTRCEDAPNASIRLYDGRGISTAHTRACRAKVVSRRGSRYTVRQSCIDAGAGPAPRFVETQTLTVRDALTFTLGKGTRAATYRYCPVYQLPPGLRSAVPR
jgi:hypothetical protein